MHQDHRIGSVLDGRYRILERLCTGGMGVVYRGERLHLRRPVAIKFLLAQLTDEPEQRACFEREAQLMSQLSHPHCVPVTDYGVSDAPYLVMEYVAGRTLKQVLAYERMAPARAVRLTRQLLSGLSHAHAQGIVHRDIKPANIMLTEVTGVGEQVRVLDFGLARLREVDEPGSSADNFLAGTPQYMAPEQWRQGAIDPRTDLYAVGIVLFEMLTGRRPFEARAPLELLRAHEGMEPPTLASLCEHLEGLPELEAVLARALRKSPGERFASAEEFSQALEALPPFVHESERLSMAPTCVFEGDALETTLAAAGAADRKVSRTFPSMIIQPPLQQASVRKRSPRRWLWLSVPSAACLWLGSTLWSSASFGPRSRDDRGAMDAPVAHAKSIPAASELTPKAPAPQAEPPEKASPAAATEAALTSLLEQERYEELLAALAPLRLASPQDARLAYLEGRALYGKGWWREAYARYHEAMKLDHHYRLDRQIASQLIRGLGSSSAYFEARYMLRDVLGADALRPLARAARQDHRSEVRQKAQALHDEISKAR